MLGLFNIELPTLTSLSSNILTYLIILIQAFCYPCLNKLHSKRLFIKHCIPLLFLRATKLKNIRRGTIKLLGF